MKNISVLVFALMISIPVFAQHLLVLKNNKRKVINIQQENSASVYYTEWPDTTKNGIKAVLQQDIQTLTVLEKQAVDSIYTVVSKENEVKETAEKKKQARWLNKHKAYYSQKVLMGFNHTMSSYGMCAETGVESIDKYRLGFGFGVEKISIPNYYALQIPFYLSFNQTILKISSESHLYALAGLGYNFVLNEDDNLGNNRLMTFGIGICFFEFGVIELYYKSQKANTLYQENGRANLAGINFGFLL